MYHGSQDRLHKVLADRILSKKVFGRDGIIPDLRAFTASSAATTLTEESFSYGALLSSVTEPEYRAYMREMVEHLADSLPIIKRSGPNSLHKPAGSLLGGHVADLVNAVQTSANQPSTTLSTTEVMRSATSEGSSATVVSQGADEPSIKLIPASKLLPPKHALKPSLDSAHAEQPQDEDNTAPSTKKNKDSDRRGKNVSPHEALAKQLMDDGILVDLSLDQYNTDKLIGMKSALIELETSILVPVNHPHLYTKGLSLNRGILLYGPPGSGKTFLCKCVAASAKVSCFVVTASHIISKWQGESEKLVSSLFQLARAKAPSIILIDEIDGLLSQRSNDEADGVRRIKNQFLQNLDEIKHHNDEQIIKFAARAAAATVSVSPSAETKDTEAGDSDGATSDRINFVIILGATNFPESIDQAAFRRFDKRIYIPLPDVEDRERFLAKNLPEHLVEAEPDLPMHMADKTANFSNADLELLCDSIRNYASRKLVEAEYFIRDTKGEWIICEHGQDIMERDTPENRALRPLLFHGRLSQLPKGGCDLPKITIKDALDILRDTFPSVKEEDLKKYADFSSKFRPG